MFCDAPPVSVPEVSLYGKGNLYQIAPGTELRFFVSNLCFVNVNGDEAPELN